MREINWRCNRNKKESTKRGGEQEQEQEEEEEVVVVVDPSHGPRVLPIAWLLVSRCDTSSKYCDM